MEMDKKIIHIHKYILVELRSTLLRMYCTTICIA